MEICDEITVTNHFMRDYYANKTSNKNVTVIPNYPPKFWLGHYYDEGKIRANKARFKAQPRILYAGSGAHFDVDNRVKHQDDFYHVLESIINTREAYKYVFLGAYPMALAPFIQSGEMEFHPWLPLYELPAFVHSLDINMMIAPLQDNTFNRAKSDIKHVEANALGIPVALQDMVTYKDAPLKFKTGPEMIDCLRRTLGNKKEYIKQSRIGHEMSKGRWLENPDNLGKYIELYTLPYKHPDRTLINPIQ
jgi:hypothetical protein